MPTTMRARRIRREQSGFTLIELLVTVTIIVVGMAGALAMVDGAAKRTAVNAQREAATGLAREILEDARSVNYGRLVPGTIVTELQKLPGLADQAPGGDWTIDRRNVPYTVTVNVCSVDDGRDGYGDHSAGPFCGGPTGSTDRNADDYKRVVVHLEWQRGAVRRELEQTGVVSNENNAAGPDLAFIGQDPPGTLITSEVSHINFDVQATTAPESIRYSVDGVVAETDTSGNTRSSFNWQINGGPSGRLPDGTYVISAVAFDDRGRSGPTRSRTIRLNRDLPPPPADTRGGWNALRSVAEIEWNRNNVPDVIGYRVYRQAGTAEPELVPGCDFLDKPDQTSCVDVSPPDEPLIQYFVVGLDDDPDTGEPREGPTSARVLAVRSDNQPNAPTLLTASASGTDVLLGWNVPAAVDPAYPGSDVAFYRIYRDGTTIANRRGIRAPAAVTDFLDGGEVGNGRSYWLTAVDQNYSESDPIGPVAGP
jgi:prepilin-type N-terminal cleavage/methylation domain-containing protein